MKSLNFKVFFWIAVAVTCVYSDASTNGKVEINGPRDFVTNGSRVLTLSASATNMGLDPDFVWTGLCLSNTNSCTIQPQLDDDGEKVQCAATNPDTEESVGATYVLHLKYPPAEAPMILISTTREAPSPGGNLTSGDELTCTVSGGEPLVTLVNFTCTNPSLSDQDDVNSADSVSSSVTVVTRGATEGPTICSCSAIWDPEPADYQKERTISFTLQTPSSPDKASSTTDRSTHWTDIMTSQTGGKTSPTNERAPGTDAEVTTVVIIVITCLLIVVLIVAIVIIIVYRRKKGTRAQNGNVESEAGETPTAAISEKQNTELGAEKKSGKMQVPASTAPEAEVGDDTQLVKAHNDSHQISELLGHSSHVVNSYLHNTPQVNPLGSANKQNEEQVSTRHTDSLLEMTISDNQSKLPVHKLISPSSASSDDSTDTTSISNTDDSINTSYSASSGESRSSTSSNDSNDSKKPLIKTNKFHHEGNEAVQ